MRKFHEAHEALPLPGSVPDMKAQSTVYVQLQNIYKAKARRDAAEVLNIVRADPNGQSVDAAEVDNFCKNAAFIKLIRGTETVSMSDHDTLRKVVEKEYNNDSQAVLMGMPLSLFPIYVALRTTSYAHNDSPLSTNDILNGIDMIFPHLPSPTTSKRYKDVAEEVARAKGCELHNISALVGGMVAQEVIKIITKQYVPIDNTCIFDGITSRAQIIRI